MRRFDNSDGQWLILIGVVIALGLTVLLVFVSQSMLAGHSSAASIMDFPKNDVREARAETVSEAAILGAQANAAPDIAQRQQWLASNFSSYTGDVSRIYASRGAIFTAGYTPGINTALPPSAQRIENLTLYLYYNNGDTLYNETTKVYL